MIKNIILPELGEGIDSVDVSDVLAKSGDKIQKDDPVIVLESDKATMEIPTTHSGIVREIFVEPGTQIKPGQALLSLEIEDEAGKQDIKTEPALAQPTPLQEKEDSVGRSQPGKDETHATKDSQSARKTPLASPAVRHFARELGADLALITGTRPKGRISKEDVQTFVKNQLAIIKSGVTPPSSTIQPDIDFSQWGEIETAPLSRIKLITADRIQQAWQTIPQVTQFDQADITELEQFRRFLQKANEGRSGKVSLLPFIIKAVVHTLIEFKAFNSSLDAAGQNIIYKKYYHFGIAVDTEQGLLVPVIRDVDQKSVMEIMAGLIDISSRARDKKVRPEELKGASFTISSLGGIGGTYFTPIVNPPEVAILGVSRMKKEPVFIKEEFVPRTILPFSLTYDHRVIDGAEAARFTRRLAETLSDISNISDLKLP